MPRQSEIAQNGLFVGHGTEKRKSRVRDGLPNRAKNFRPIARTFSNAPHPEKTNFLSREPRRSRVARFEKGGSLRIVQPVRLNNDLRARATSLELAFLILIREIK